MKAELSEPPDEFMPIVSEVCRRLRGRLWRFAIQRCEEGIVLSGEAPSFYVKQLAQHTVGKMTRLLIVRNEIEVA
jgi:hypothetical protein